MRRAKIVCTLGPAVESIEKITELIDAGMNMARLNLSHGSHDEHQKRLDLVRAAAKKANKAVAILVDLQGPKIRLGRFSSGPHELSRGDTFTITTDDIAGTKDKVSTTYKGLPGDCKAGDAIMIDDGKVSVQVVQVKGNDVITKVIQPGMVSNNKGINLPGVAVSLPALSEKDIADLRWGLKAGVDFIALSFVRNAADIKDIHKIMDEVGVKVPVIAKIEKPQAVENLQEIVDAFDGIMVARGDLGVELPIEDVPMVQKRCITMARESAKPVIVATQMLESMIESPMPTRAEVSDVATAIYEGADAIMLSAESAAGQYPVEAVRTMDNVAREVEHDPTYREVIEASRRAVRHTVADGIVAAAREIAETTEIKVICCYTQSGRTAALVARERPRVPVIGMTSLRSTARRMALTWGVTCVMTPELERFKQAVVNAARAARSLGMATEEDQIVVTAGVPFNVQGTTNILRVAPCAERLIYASDPE